jgi:hypothetical protein
MGQEDHLQPIPSHGRQVGATESEQVGSLSISQGGAEHETFYASPATCLGLTAFDVALRRRQDLVWRLKETRELLELLDCPGRRGA